MEGDRRPRGGHFKNDRRTNKHRGGYGAGGKPYDRNNNPRNYERRGAQTARGGHRQYNQRHRGGGYGNRKYNQRGNRPNTAKNMAANADKNSYFYKYYYGPWPEVKEIEVTLETEIPAVKEEDILSPPSQEEYAGKMQECDDKMQELRSKITEINDKKREITSSNKEKLKGQHVEVQGKSFKELLGEKNETVAKSRELKDIIDKQNKKMDKLKIEMDKMSKSIDVKCKTIEDVDKKIAALEKSMDTGSYSTSKQNGMLKQIKFLNDSKKFYSIFEKVNGNFEECKQIIFDTRKKKKTLSEKISEYNAILDEMNKDFKSKKELSDKFKEDLDKLEDKVQGIKKEIGELFEKKKEIREQHFKSKFDYEAQQEELGYFEYLKHQKDKLLKEEREKQRQIEEEKRKEKEKEERQANMPNPYEDDMSQIQYLITQLKLKKRDFENNVTRQEAEQKRMTEDLERKKEIEKKAEEGKIQVHHKTKGELLVVGSNNKRRKHNKRHKPKVQEDKKGDFDTPAPSQKLEFKYDVVKGIVELGVDVPDKIEDIQATIEKLEQLNSELEDKGKAELEELFEHENWEEMQDKYQKSSAKDDIMLEYDEEENYNNTRQETQEVKKQPKQKMNAEDENEFMALGS